MKRFRKTKPRRMKSVEIELSQWVKFNEKSEEEKIPVSNQIYREEPVEKSVKKDREEPAKKSVKKDREEPVEKSVKKDKEQPSAGVKKRVRTAKKGTSSRKIKKRELEEERFAEEFAVETNRRSTAWEAKKDYALSRAERIKSAAEEMELLKQEYRILAEYHNDINLLKDLPEDGMKRIRDNANVIIRLQNDRKAYQDDMTRLDDGKYEQMSMYTEDMPDVIRKLTSDELYVAKLKSEIDRLEGEKGEQQYESKDVVENQGKMKSLTIFFICALLALFGGLLVLQLEFEKDTQVFALISAIVFVIMAIAVFVRHFNNVNRAKRAEHQLNKIIKQQNKIKIQYVNAKNGVDYVYKKYKIHSASELLFQWEQFMVTKNSRENYKRSGNELQYYITRLQKTLEEYRIQDAGIWMNQVEFLADGNKMKQLQIELEGKIEQAKIKIENCRKVMNKAKDDISLLAIRNPEHADAIKELIDTLEDDGKEM